MAAAAKILRLYPPSSQMPKQAVDAMLAPLSEFLTTEPSMVLSLARNGFTSKGEAIGKNIPGAADLSDHLRTLGIADIEFVEGVGSSELLAFLALILSPPEAIQSAGGLASALATAGASSIKVTGVSLVVSDSPDTPGDQDVDEFLRGLARDPEQLSAWVSVAANGDPSAFGEGLAELEGAAGSIGLPRLIDSLTKAFGSLDPAGRDALLDLSLEERAGADLAKEMVAQLGSGDLAAALCEGSKGDNLLSLSSTVTRLPLGSRLKDVLGQVREIMSTQGHTDSEMQFFDRMVDLRSSGKQETPLAVAEQSYVQIAEVARVSKEEMASSLYDVPKSASRVSERTVQTMLMLLDQQNDFKLYCRSLDNLASMVPRLIGEGQLDLADKILNELDTRQASSVHPWPELGDKFRAALVSATSRPALEALIASAIADPGLIVKAKQLLQHGGEAAVQTLVEVSLDQTDPRALEITGQLVGRRLGDFLTAAAARAPAAHVATIIRHLSKETHGRAQSAIETLIRRPDAASRCEAARGLSDAGLSGVRYLETLLADPSPEVAVAAARALGAIDVPTAAGVLDNRLSAIQLDGKDFPVAREIITALAKLSDQSAADALERLTRRRSLFKRGHFAEVQELAQAALDARRPPAKDKSS
jgi:hypothetical protein